MSHQVLTSSGKLVLIREGSAERPEGQDRAVNGKLLNPPKMYVFWYDEKFLDVEFEEISFEAAKALAPEQFKELTQKLSAARSAEWSVYDAKRKAEQEEQALKKLPLNSWL